MPTNCLIFGRIQKKNLILYVYLSGYSLFSRKTRRGRNEQCLYVDLARLGT